MVVRGDYGILRHTSRLRAGEASLASLVGPLASRFHSWRGASERRYVVSVSVVDRAAPRAGLPDYDCFVLVPVVVEGLARRPLFVRAIEREADKGPAIAEALARGAQEWHVHLIAGTRSHRAVIVEDLVARHMSAGAEALSA